MVKSNFKCLILRPLQTYEHKFFWREIFWPEMTEFNQLIQLSFYSDMISIWVD